MSLLRYLFPSFEKPVAREPFNIQLKGQRRSLAGVGFVLLVSALFGGVLLALPEAPQHATTPPRFLVAKPVVAPIAATRQAETTASAVKIDNDDDLSAAKLSVLCGDRPTARRVCVEAKAARESLLADALARAEAKAEAERKAAMAAKVAAAARAEAEAADTNTAARPKPAPRAAEDRSSEQIERLVHVYDHIAPDGRRVPVYRRVDGGYEFGTIEEAAAPQQRRADARPNGLLGLLGLQ